MLFILKRGRVRVFRVSADGRALTTGIIAPGTIFGEMVLLGQHMSDSYAEAFDDVTVYVMIRADVHQLLTDARIAARITEILGRRLADLKQCLSDSAFKSVAQRIATTLTILAGAQPPANPLRPGGRHPQIALTHEQLAALAGTSRETCTKVLHEYADQGLLRLARGHRARPRRRPAARRGGLTSPNRKAATPHPARRRPYSRSRPHPEHTGVDMRPRTLAPAVLAAVLLSATGCAADDGSTAGTGAGAAPSTTSAQSPAPSDPGKSGASGAQVPAVLDFTGTTVDGKPFDAKTLAGKPTVLWFWAPWCPKCKAQAAETAKVAADYAGKANVVGVAGLDKNAAMKDFVTDTKTGGFPQLSDEKGEVWKRFKVTEQSRYVILDKDGKTVFEGVLPAGKGLAEKVAGLTG
ncbi:redoxin domain-containing protein [Streptomyces sp. AP-93]|uniref:redoxin domain-containing protein n=1 Tax=Streptomyces sp. AP-93 TaxID=2929048 RepID=UPI001FAF92EC|nr:redoxin domain-containing protein [Streptomyces sp. AP-93]MCJ0872576.1 redoxin domain-containing protein [Streptomyces sp. AP-93]